GHGVKAGVWLVACCAASRARQCGGGEGESGLVAVVVAGPGEAPLAQLDHRVLTVRVLIARQLTGLGVGVKTGGALAPGAASAAQLAEGDRVAAGLGDRMTPVAEGAVAVSEPFVVLAAGEGEVFGSGDDAHRVGPDAEVAGVVGAADSAVD